jgi:hypothetical protein
MNLMFGPISESSFEGVVNLTDSVEGGVFVRMGGFGDVYKSSLRIKGGRLASLCYAPRQINIAVKVIKIPSLESDEEKKTRFKASIATFITFIK